MYCWIPKINVCRDILACLALFIYSIISQEKDKKSTKNLSKTCHWKLIFVICSYSTWARRHARQFDTWARKARYHNCTQGTLASKHISTQNTLSREHVSRQDTLARKHARNVGKWSRKYAKRVGTWARKARYLADSFLKHLRVTVLSKSSLQETF